MKNQDSKKMDDKLKKGTKDRKCVSDADSADYVTKNFSRDREVDSYNEY